MRTQLRLGRRRALLSLLGLATQSEAFALSPRAPPLSSYVPLSQFIVVARVERFIFRGLRRPDPLEFDRDFEDEGEPGSRAVDVVLSVEKVIFKKAAGDLPALVRIHWQVEREERAKVIGTRRVILLGREHRYRREDGTAMEMYSTVISPLPIEQEMLALEAISQANR